MTLSEYKISSSGFVVVMISKAKTVLVPQPTSKPEAATADSSPARVLVGSSSQDRTDSNVSGEPSSSNPSSHQQSEEPTAEGSGQQERTGGELLTEAQASSQFRRFHLISSLSSKMNFLFLCSYW